VADHRVRLGAGEQPQCPARSAASATAHAAPHRVPAIRRRTPGDPRCGRAGCHRRRRGDRGGAAQPGQCAGDLATGVRPGPRTPSPLRPGPEHRDEECLTVRSITVEIEICRAVVGAAHIVAELVTGEFADDRDTHTDSDPHADVDTLDVATLDVDAVIAVAEVDDTEPELLLGVDVGYAVSTCSAMFPPCAPSL
jgi:hypothetical protein